MKAIFFIKISVCLLLYGCNTLSENDAIQEYIPGTYIRYSQHEFGNEHDTMVITLQNKISREYKLVRKWKYERKLDGKDIEPEYKSFATSAIYDEKNRLLQEVQTGGSYTFDTRQNVLFAGTTKYLKVK